MTEPVVSADSAILIIAIAFLFLVVAVAAITVLAYCRIFAKAGFHRALGLLVLLPGFNYLVLIYLAFADWPVQRECRRLRQNTGEARSA